MADPVTIRGEGITLDLLLWRIYGVRGRSLLAQTLAANPGLASLGPEIPLNTVVQIPDLPSQTTPTVERVSLFSTD
jgi:phage tail protein X